jgi:hypothetical protein
MALRRGASAAEEVQVLIACSVRVTAGGGAAEDGRSGGGRRPVIMAGCVVVSLPALFSLGLVGNPWALYRLSFSLRLNDIIKFFSKILVFSTWSIYFYHGKNISKIKNDPNKKINPYILIFFLNVRTS